MNTQEIKTDERLFRPLTKKRAWQFLMALALYVAVLAALVAWLPGQNREFALAMLNFVTLVIALAAIFLK